MSLKENSARRAQLTQFRRALPIIPYVFGLGAIVLIFTGQQSLSLLLILFAVFLQTVLLARRQRRVLRLLAATGHKVETPESQIRPTALSGSKARPEKASALRAPNAATQPREVENIRAEKPVDSFKWSGACPEASELLVTVSSHNLSADASKCALINVTFYDKDGKYVLPESDGPLHPDFGRYFYLNDSDALIETEVTIQVPSGAVSVHLTGKQWRKQHQTEVKSITVLLKARTAGQTDAETMRTFLEDLPQDADLIVVYTTAPAFGDKTLSLRSNRLSRLYSEAGARIIYFPFGNVAPDKRHVSERIIQLSRSALPSLIEFAEPSRPGKNIFICSSFADISALGTMEYLERDGWTTIYEARDDMEEFNRVGYSKWFIASAEARVATRAHGRVAVSPRLVEKVSLISGTDDCRRIPNGAPDDLVETYAAMRSLDQWQKRLKHPRVGYIGHLTRSWFDWEMLRIVADRLPHVGFDLIGHGAPEEISLPENVILHGPLPHSECAEFAKTWMVGLIPFRPSTLARAVDPNKLYEYLAFGLRVVSTTMGSVDEAPSTLIADSPDSFFDAVVKAMEPSIDATELNQIEEYLDETRWTRRAEAMLSFMEEVSK